MLTSTLKNRNNNLKLFVNNFSSKAPRNDNSSVPILPAVSISSEIVRLTPFTTSKRRAKKLYASNGGGNGGGGIPFITEKSIIPTSFNSSTKSDSSNDFINLFSIYGNILIKEDASLLCPYKSNSSSNYNYPIDDNLIKLFENSAKLWYENSATNSSEVVPTIMSINAPSRNSTWELAQHLAAKCGKSHLALIPFSMFYELLQTCSSKNNEGNFKSYKDAKEEAKEFGDFILKNLTKAKNRNLNSPPLHFQRNSSIKSAAVIQVIEYLFACLEASVGSNNNSNNASERFTLMIDGLGEYLQSQKGIENGVINDLTNWANIFESAGRRIILGGRCETFIDEKQVEGSESSNSGMEEDDSSSSSNNKSVVTTSNNKSSSNPTSTLIAVYDFIIKAAESLATQGGQHHAGLVNVRIEGKMLKLTVNGPKNDKRKLLNYSQLLGIDRKKDLFDTNLSLLKSIAGTKWNMNLSLGLKSRFDFPSKHPEVWERLSEAGRGILVKRKLDRDEFNEIIMYILGKGSQEFLNCENLFEAIENVSQIRHDPTKFSSDDLSHLLAGRQVSMASLTKYEKRFINCISTATTQTQFKDISLSKETIKTMRSLTSLPLTHPELFTQGILKNSLTGVLLFGPPGTGKTMLARAVAQESGATFLAVNMSNIFDMWVGEGEKNVKGLFSLARKLSPSIIFIDEIDALLERRSSISGRSSRLEIVNEFMSQWDGLSSNLNSGVIVMGATNRPFVLDDAVLRRLPRRLLIDLPDAENRHEILINLLKDNLCEVELLESLPEMSKKMEFYSGSDLKNVAITAALKSAMRIASNESGRNSSLIISKRDFEEAAREVPASLSDQMDSLIELRKWNEMYGETRNIGRQSIKKFGFA